jgi:tape measure domain-containing protein
MADLATLQVKVDAAQAIRDTQRLGDALKQTAQQGPLVSAAMGKTEAQIRKLQQAEVAAYKEADRMSAALKKQEQALKDVGRQMQNVETSTRQTTSAMGSLKTVFAAIVGSAALREIITLADSYKLINARLSLVTKSTEELERVQERLFASAQRTRSNYEDVAGLYVRVARNMKELGRSEGELLRFTELVNMQLQIAGATTQEAASGVMQLGQALSKGKLDGDEFRTVLEAMPTVADALTKSLAGGVRAELFKLAEQGKITGTDIVQALLNIERETREKFSQMPVTVGQAFVNMKNDVLRSIGEIDREMNATSKIATTLQGFGIIFRFVAAGYRDMSVNFDSETGKFERSTARFGDATRSLLRDLRDMSEGLPLHGDVAAAAMAAIGRGTAGAAQAVAEAERQRQERFKAWQQEKARANEKAQWELEEINRAQKLLDLRLKASAAASGFSMGRAGAGISGVQFPTFGGSTLGMATAAAQSPTIRFAAELQRRTMLYEIEKARKEGQARLAEALERQAMNSEIAENFRENMQRALGDFFAEFVTQGKVSMRQMFDAIKQTGGQMAGQGISSVITGMLPKSMGPFGSILAGLGLVGLGGLFGSRDRTPRMSAEEKIAQAQNRYASIELLRQQRADEMRKFVEGRNGGRGGVIQSVGTVLQETTASRMIGELVAIRVATTRTADAVAGGGNGMSGAQVNVTVQGGMGGDLKQVGADVAAAVDRLLGTRVQALRLTSGAAVTT